MTKKNRLGIVASHPVQYHTPFFRLLSEQPEIDLTVYYCWNSVGAYDGELGVHVNWGVPLLEGYKYEFPRNYSLKPGAWFGGQVNPAIVNELRRRRYDAILVQGYTTGAAWLGLLGGWLTHTPIILRGETDLLLPRSKGKLILKRILLSRLFRSVGACLYSCSTNANYYKHYGVNEAKLFFCPCAVDNEFWRGHGEKLRGGKANLKRERGISPGAPVILFVGRLSVEKRPRDLLEAFEGLENEGSNAWLVFVGEGPLKDGLGEYARDRGLRRVSFAGFKDQPGLAAFYGMADILVLPSDRDPSPKVLNEAMNFGLPVITTNRVGTAQDMVEHGESGFIYPCGEVGALAGYLRKLLEAPKLRERMGARSVEIVAEWSLERGVQGMLGALNYLRNGRERVGRSA